MHEIGAIDNKGHLVLAKPSLKVKRRRCNPPQEHPRGPSRSAASRDVERAGCGKERSHSGIHAESRRVGGDRTNSVDVVVPSERRP